MSEQIKPHVDEEDGRLYFNYHVGAELEFTTAAGKRFRLRIVDCEYENGTEYYFLESAGKLLPTRFSVDKLKKQLTAAPYEVIDEGELQELPLLVEEVQLYYQERIKELNFDNAEANKKLNGTEYKSLVRAASSLKKRLMLAEADGREEDAAQIRKDLSENEAKRSKILADKGIDYKVLTKVKDCEICGDTGIVDGKICECALERTEQIKAFNAALRLAELAGT